MKRNGNERGADRLAQALGWFSIGLGVSEILAPRPLSRFIGIDEHPWLMRALGIREMLSGVGIVAQSHPAWLWSRVAGDGMDLALLAVATAGRNSNKGKLFAATAAVAGVAALDTVLSVQA